MTDFHAPEVGTQLPPLTLVFTRADLVRYAGASGDFNPIHWSDRSAARLNLESVIAHGMLTMGRALRVVTDWVGDPERVVAYGVRFTKPVPVPDDDTGVEVQVTGTVKAIADGIATIAIDALLGETKVLGSATAEVRLD
ncbi:dehydratase [Propioniciclava sp. MC1595]|uniref:MaoC/PaaZ C-terminal domain-containing protein n=1 Tax=unclassified Propioniciclava TaxID=2642922 RepID=UPI001603F368|nr:MULTISPECIES: MaoC/PaaZ C-terminal domain-containing protein [unclassified Propioniciclava]MBB1493934.1 dehydratase [Propioniciclava sp. MC1595]MBB1500957.1 dehydratase [Propioniciclava sp. MC1683]NLE17635.1 dehydratase [Propioniciclava sp.]QTE25322.1 dehydratase [Propioniciclava sp. MC1595]